MNPEIKWCSNDDYHVMTCKFLRSEMNVNPREWSTIHNLEGTKRIGIRLAHLYKLMEEHGFMFTGKTIITIDPPQAEIIVNTSVVLERFKLDVMPAITTGFLTLLTFNHQRRYYISMKLVIVTPFNEKCGVAEYSRLLKEQLETRSDIEVELLSYRKLSEITDLESTLLHVQYVPGLFPDKELFRKTVMEYQNPIIITAHHFDNFIKSLQDNVDKIIVHDKSFVNEPKITFIVQGCPVFNEIKDEKAKKALRRELSIPSYAKVICSFGFMMRWKRIDYILESFAPYLALNRDLFIVMLHSYHEHDEEEGIRVEKELERIINNYNIDSQCIINHTFLDKEIINKYIQASDIGILFSFDEIDSHGSSAVMKECISGRCPVIVSDIPHYGDININLNARIPAGDITSFIYRTLDMLYNTDELGLWKRTMRRLYNKHNYDEFAKKHIEIYEAVIGANQ